MNQNLTIDFIIKLYRNWATDLKNVRRYESELYNKKGFSKIKKSYLYRALDYGLKKFGLIIDKNDRKMKPALDDIEAEITYLLIREIKPKTIVEISPARGWSTSWILNAINENKQGKLYSYDLIDKARKFLPKNLTSFNWNFFKGDIKKNLDKVPNKIDYLFMDSDHSGNFCRWYIENIFPKLKDGAIISVHDVIRSTDFTTFYGEGQVIINWLNKNKIRFFTASPIIANGVYDQLMSLKKKLKIAKKIHFHYRNPMIFFIYKN